MEAISLVMEAARAVSFAFVAIKPTLNQFVRSLTTTVTLRYKFVVNGSRDRTLSREHGAATRVYWEPKPWLPPQL